MGLIQSVGINGTFDHLNFYSLFYTSIVCECHMCTLVQTFFIITHAPRYFPVNKYRILARIFFLFSITSSSVILNFGEPPTPVLSHHARTSLSKETHEKKKKK